MRYVIERYPIRLPKDCDMDMLDRELGRYLVAGYSASITDNKMCSHVDLLTEKSQYLPQVMLSIVCIPMDQGMPNKCVPTRACRINVSRPGHVVKLRLDRGMS